MTPLPPTLGRSWRAGGRGSGGGSGRGGRGAGGRCRNRGCVKKQVSAKTRRVKLGVRGGQWLIGAKKGFTLRSAPAGGFVYLMRPLHRV